MKKVLLLSLVVMMTLGIRAQEMRPMPNIDELHKQKWKILSEEARLTADELARVEPIYFEYENAVWALHQQKRCFFKSKNTKESDTKPNYAQLNDQYIDLEANESQLLQQYHQKLKKILKPGSLYNYYKADREFKHKLLKDLRRMDKFQQGGRGEN